MITGEDSRIEYKYFFPHEEIKWIKTVIAFLNSGLGGKIYFGVQDDGTKTGVQFFNYQEERKDLKISKIHFCNNKFISKCVDRALIYISDRIAQDIFPKVLASYYYIEISEKDPYIICLTIFPTREIVYGLERSKIEGNKTGVYLRSGSQTVQLNRNEIKVLEKNRSKKVNFDYISSLEKKLVFKKMHSFYAKKYPNYQNFMRFFQSQYELFIPGTKKYNYEAFLLSDENNVKIKINNFSSNLHPNFSPKQIILNSMSIIEFIEFLLIFFRDINIDKKLWDEKAVEGIIRNIILHNDYYNFNNTGPIIEIFDDRLVFYSYQKGGINIILENQISAIKYPLVRKIANEIFGNGHYGITDIKRIFPSCIVTDEISVQYTITFKNPNLVN